VTNSSINCSFVATESIELFLRYSALTYLNWRPKAILNFQKISLSADRTHMLNIL